MRRLNSKLEQSRNVGIQQRSLVVDHDYDGAVIISFDYHICANDVRFELVPGLANPTKKLIFLFF